MGKATNRNKFDKKQKCEPMAGIKAEYGWLSPDGSFYACDYSGEVIYTHQDIAEYFIRQMGIKSPIIGDQNYLMQKGWIRLDVNIMPEPNIGMTRDQRRTMQDLIQCIKKDAPDFLQHHKEQMAKYVELLLKRGL